jgi:putative FmdB family regulatory protein
MRFERRQRFTDDPIKTCPKCGGRAHRVIHAPVVTFKGKAFYVTDNRKARSSTVATRARKGSRSLKTSETQEDAR